MFAEITVTVAEPFSDSLAEQLRIAFAPVVPPHVAIAYTGLGDLAPDLPPVMVAQLNPTHVVIVSRRNDTRLGAYVELVNVPLDLRSLRSAAEAVTDDLATFLRVRGHRLASAQIGIRAEGVLLQAGHKRSWAQRLIALARKEVALRFSLPVATFLASLWFDSDVRRATITAVGAFVGLLLWLVGSVTLEEERYTYE